MGGGGGGGGWGGGGLLQVFCCTGGDETRGLDLEKESLLAAYLIFWHPWAVI